MDILEQCDELRGKLADVNHRAEMLFAKLAVYPDLETEIAEETNQLEKEMVDYLNGLLRLDRR